MHAVKTRPGVAESVSTCAGAGCSSKNPAQIAPESGPWVPHLWFRPGVEDSNLSRLRDLDLNQGFLIQSQASYR
jgi:hypothetical protein